MQLMIIVLVSLFATTNLKAQSHFVFEGGNPADPVYTIYFFGATLNGVDLQAGDEIAVYDGTKMVGAAVLTSVCASENYNNFVSAFKTLTSGTGYVPGHPVTFKCWDASAGVEATDFTINYLDLYNAWGGVTAGDVLLYKKHIAGISSLSGIFLASGDVNASGSLTAGDVLLIKKRIAGIISSFTVGDWIFNNGPITVSGSNVTHVNG